VLNPLHSARNAAISGDQPAGHSKAITTSRAVRVYLSPVTDRVKPSFFLNGRQ
jgi:hypothetical protein